MTNLNTENKFTCTDLDPGKKESDLELMKVRETFFKLFFSDRNQGAKCVKSRISLKILGQNSLRPLLSTINRTHEA
jgi:hypothetical protein